MRDRFGFLRVLVVGHLFVGLANGRPEYEKLFERCEERGNVFDCLKRRALRLVESAVEDNTVYVINDFVSVARDPGTSKRRADEASRTLTETRENNSTEESLDERLDRKLTEYLTTRSIRLNIPTDVFQGRKKKDKYGGILLMGGLAMAGMMAQLAMGKIALLAGTALITAKIALVLSAIIGLKKLASGGGGATHEVIYATAAEHHTGGGGGGGHGYGGSSGGWQRSLDVRHLT